MSIRSGVVNSNVYQYTLSIYIISICIRVNNPTLNRNIGKLNLHHIWDRVPLNTPGLKIKRHA